MNKNQYKAGRTCPKCERGLLAWSGKELRCEYCKAEYDGEYMRRNDMAAKTNESATKRALQRGRPQ
jgi:hypothetical protein